MPVFKNKTQGQYVNVYKQENCCRARKRKRKEQTAQ